MKLSSILIFILVLGFGCGKKAVDPKVALVNPFFDLKEYFEKEMKVVRKSVTKTTIFEGKTEISNLKEIDLKKELKIFADANLNKVAWYEKYTIQKNLTPKGNSQVTYETNDEKLKTKRVDIFKNDSSIDSILVHNQMTSMILDSDQYLSYYPNNGYRILIKQKGNLIEVSDMEIKVEF